MQNTIPTDPVEIQAEIVRLLETTPESTDRGRLFHLLNALNANSGGSGVPMSVATADGLELYDNAIIRDLTGNPLVSFAEPYTRFNAVFDCIGYTDDPVAVTPFVETAFDGSYRVGAGIAKVWVNDGKIYVTKHSKQNSTEVVVKCVGTMPATHTEVWISNGLDADYGSQSVYVMTGKKDTTSQVEIQLHALDELAGTISPVGSVISVPLSLGSSSTSRLRLAFSTVGTTDYIAVFASATVSNAYKITLGTIHKTTGAWVSSVSNVSTSGYPDECLGSLASYNFGDPYVVATAVGRTDSSTEGFDIYQLNGSTGALTKKGTTAFTKRGAEKTAIPQISMSGGAAYLGLVAQATYESSANVTYSLLNGDTHAVTNHTLDLSQFDDTHISTNPCFVYHDNSDYSGGFMVGLQRKDEAILDLFNPTNLKPVSMISTWFVQESTVRASDTAKRTPICIALDDYIYIGTANAKIQDMECLITEPWEWYTLCDLTQIAKPAPKLKLPTYENALAAGMPQLNNIAGIKTDGTQNYNAMILPPVNTVVQIGLQAPVLIPKEAPVGTEYLIIGTYALSGNYPQGKHYGDLVDIIAENDTGSANWMSLVTRPRMTPKNGSTLGCVIHIVKTGADSFKSQYL